MPPSPPDKRSFWRRTPTSTTSSSHRSALSENEPFSISRESFDSYRCSFDISARSPITHSDPPISARQSLDSSLRSPRTPRSALTASHFKPPASTSEDDFEDVNLDPSSNPYPRSKPPTSSSNSYFTSSANGTAPVNANDETKPKRRSIFARFGDSNGNEGANSSATDGVEGGSRPGSSHRGFHLPGRKRGQSGQGAELGHLVKPVAAPAAAVGKQGVKEGAKEAEGDGVVQ